MLGFLRRHMPVCTTRCAWSWRTASSMHENMTCRLAGDRADHPCAGKRKRGVQGPRCWRGMPCNGGQSMSLISFEWLRVLFFSMQVLSVPPLKAFPHLFLHPELEICASPILSCIWSKSCPQPLGKFLAGRFVPLFLLFLAGSFCGPFEAPHPPFFGAFRGPLPCQDEAPASQPAVAARKVRKKAEEAEPGFEERPVAAVRKWFSSRLPCPLIFHTGVQIRPLWGPRVFVHVSTRVPLKVPISDSHVDLPGTQNGLAGFKEHVKAARGLWTPLGFARSRCESRRT